MTATENKSTDRWSSADWYFLLGLSWLGALLYLFIAKSGFGYDATQYLAIGEAWHHGVVPYTQVVEVKPPGVFLLARLIISIFGEKVVVFRWAVLILDLAVAAATVLYCKEWIKGWGRWLVAAGVLGVAFLLQMQYFLTEQPLAIFGALGAICLERGQRNVARTWLFSAGVGFGVALLFKAVAMFYVIAADRKFEAKPSARASGRAAPNRARRIGAALGGQRSTGAHDVLGLAP